jgi:hypothetical protein
MAAASIFTCAIAVQGSGPSLHSNGRQARSIRDVPSLRGVIDVERTNVRFAPRAFAHKQGLPTGQCDNGNTTRKHRSCSCWFPVR